MQSDGLDRTQQNFIWYQSTRYLRGISKADLEVRVSDVFNNILRVSDEAMVVPLKGFGTQGEWLDKLLHCQFEFELVFGRFPQDLSPGTLQGVLPFDATIRERIIKAAKPFKQVTSPSLLRFGSMKNMLALFEGGELMLQPAKKFLEEDLAAVQDDECSISVRGVLKAEEVRAFVENPEDVSDDIADQHIELNFETDNYAIFCMGKVPELRMIANWNAEAVVIINDPPKFEKRLEEAVRGAFSGADISFSDVEYLDPYFPPSGIPDVCAVKHFRFSYQKERRLIVHGCNVGKGKLLSLGPITDIASYVPLL